MSGAAYTARGASTGQAPTTVYFGVVPDKYNMLLPDYYRDTGSVHGTVFVSGFYDCSFINKWIPWDIGWDKGASGNTGASCSIGATTTAPDGTSTAYHVTEAANGGASNYHILLAGCSSQLTSPVIKRLAIFAKAAERTRCVLGLGEFIGIPDGFGFNNTDFGVRCIFDLAGGRIGVAAVAYGTGFAGSPANWGAVGSGIIPYGNGWYLCYIDVSLDTGGVFNSSSVLQAYFGPDAGSGTGAANFKYVGNGTSGVYAWRANMLPPRAWSMNNVSFFDDFPNLNSIDINNTKAPGFNWYVAGSSADGINFVWPSQFGGTVFLTPIPPAPAAGSLSVISYGGSSTVLKVPHAPVGNFPTPNIQSTTPAGGGFMSFNGFALVPPFLMELRIAWDYSISGSGQELAWWCQPLEYLTTAGTPTPFSPLYMEIDYVDSGSAGSELAPVMAHFDGDVDFPSGQDWQMQPYADISLAWQSTLTYQNGNVVGYAGDGNAYQATTTTTPGLTPPSNPGQWTLLGPVGGPIVDFGDLHIFANMYIVDNSRNGTFPDCGVFLAFFDGIYTGNTTGGGTGEIVFGARASENTSGRHVSTTLQRYDSSHENVTIGASGDRNAYTDWVKITQ